jgi:cytochrome c-type biogenesis protein CcmF
MVLVGITGSNAFKLVVDGNLSQGESLEVGRFELVYDDLTFEQEPGKDVARAVFTVRHDGEVVGQIDPVREYYYASDQVWTRVDIHSTLAGDLYVTLLGFSEDGTSVTIEAQVNPLVGWMWIGGGVLVVGGLIALWPQRWARARELRAAQAGGSRPAKVSTDTGVRE